MAIPFGSSKGKPKKKDGVIIPTPKTRYDGKKVSELEAKLKILGVELMTAFGQTLMEDFGFTQLQAQEAVTKAFDRAKSNRADNNAQRGPIPPDQT